MTFDPHGNHLWTSQRGDWSMDRALDLQVDGAREVALVGVPCGFIANMKRVLHVEGNLIL